MKERELFNLQQVLQKLNIESLNSMQAAAVEHCAKNNSMVLLSPTGTGKTLAYLLPLLQRLNIGSSPLANLHVKWRRCGAQWIRDVV